jgi:hypothetical protein
VLEAKEEMVAYNPFPDNGPVEGVALKGAIEGRLRSLVISRDISADFRRFPGPLGMTNHTPIRVILLRWRFSD